MAHVNPDASLKHLLLNFARRYPCWISIAIALGFAGALLNGISTTLIVPILLIFLGQKIDSQTIPSIVYKLISNLNNTGVENPIIPLLGGAMLIIILKNLIIYLSSVSSSKLSQLLITDIGKEGLLLLLEVDLDFYFKTKAGDLVNCMNQEIERTSRAIGALLEMATMMMTIAVFMGILLLISWQLTLASLILLLPVSLINQYFIKQAKKTGKIISKTSQIYGSALLEVINGIRLVKAHGNEKKEYEKLERLISKRSQALFLSEVSWSAIKPVNEITGVAALLLILGLCRALFAYQLESLLAVMLTYLFMLFRLIPLVGNLNFTRGIFANNFTSLKIVLDLLKRHNKPFITNGFIPYRKLTQGIRFEQVSFAYPGQANLVLEQINLSILPGETLALVGASGSGKSTLVDLLLRFYDPTGGSITLDSRDLREYDLYSLRQAIGFVSQDIFLFSASVYENIIYAQENVTRDEVIQAAKQANAYEFIMQLPERFDTQIGDRGVMLSGGQRQRIAIARALLRNPAILILDEATSALDTFSEHLVQQALDKLIYDRTTLVIAHRLSTVRKADQIAVMDQGKIVEIGSHEELLRKSNYYARLHFMQFGEDFQNE